MYSEAEFKMARCVGLYRDKRGIRVPTAIIFSYETAYNAPKICLLSDAFVLKSEADFRGLAYYTEASHLSNHSHFGVCTIFFSSMSLFFLNTDNFSNGWEPMA